MGRFSVLEISKEALEGVKRSRYLVRRVMMMMTSTMTRMITMTTMRMRTDHWLYSNSATDVCRKGW